MIDAITGSVTVFDAIVFAIVLLSALMALSRGFMRELATLSALFFASIAAYLGRLYMRDAIANFLPDTTADYVADLIVVITAFSVVYILTRMLMGKFTNLIQGPGGVNIIDRVAGLIFGVARGLAVPFVTAWLIINVIPSEAVPAYISESATYPYFERGASMLNANIPDIADQAEGLFDPATASSPDE